VATGRQRLTEQQRQEAEALGAAISARVKHGDLTKIWKAAKVNRSTLRYWLSGEHRIPDGKLPSIAAALKTTPAALLEDAALLLQRPLRFPPNGASRPVDNGTAGVSPGGDAAVSSGPGNSSTSGHELDGHVYRVYRWGMQVDVRRPDDAPPGSSFRHPLATEESLRVGDNGFGLKVEDDSLTLWECAENEPVRHGSVVWCNPDNIDGIQDGDLIVVRDPTKGLVAGVYRRDAATEGGALFLETADATASAQQRRHIQRSWIVGPVVYCTRGGIPRLVERRRRGDSESPEPAGPAFVGAHSAQG
jgi:hypothetical protein